MVNRAGRERRDVGGKSRGGFVYKPRSEKSFKERAERTGGRFDSPIKAGIDVWRPKQGDNTIRILPPTWEDPNHYGLDVWMHKRIGPDNSNYLCPRKMSSKACPVCDAAKESTDAGETDEAKALQPSQGTVCWILDRDGDDPDQPQIMILSWTMDRDIAALCHDKRKGSVLVVDHPDEGYDLSFKRQGNGLKTKYFGYTFDRNSSPLSDDDKVQQEILDYIEENPIPSVLKFYDTSYLEKVIAGTAGEKSEDDDQEEDRSERRAKANGRARDEQDEEDSRPSRRGRDPEDEEEDSRHGRRAKDEDEDERPTRRRRDEDEEEKPARRGRASDDDEEEKPARRGRSRSDEDEEEKPARRRRDEVDEDDAPKRGKRARDGDEEDVAEEEDKDDRPARRARSDEDEEEERPARRRRRDEDEEEERRPRR